MPYVTRHSNSCPKTYTNIPIYPDNGQRSKQKEITDV